MLTFTPLLQVESHCLFPFSEDDDDSDEEDDFDQVGIKADDFIIMEGESAQSKAFSLATKLQKLRQLQQTKHAQREKELREEQEDDYFF